MCAEFERVKISVLRRDRGKKKKEGNRLWGDMKMVLEIRSCTLKRFAAYLVLFLKGKSAFLHFAIAHTAVEM